MQGPDYAITAGMAARGHTKSFKEDVLNYIEFAHMWAGRAKGRFLNSVVLFVKFIQRSRDRPHRILRTMRWYVFGVGA